MKVCKPSTDKKPTGFWNQLQFKLRHPFWTISFKALESEQCSVNTFDEFDSKISNFIQTLKFKLFYFGDFGSLVLTISDQSLYDIQCMYYTQCAYEMRRSSQIESFRFVCRSTKFCLSFEKAYWCRKKYPNFEISIQSFAIENAASRISKFNVWTDFKLPFFLNTSKSQRLQLLLSFKR